MSTCNENEDQVKQMLHEYTNVTFKFENFYKVHNQTRKTVRNLL